MRYPWGDSRRFNSYSRFMESLFGGRVQKISVDAGFSCPNRDGRISMGGCTFCNNGAFTPSYCMSRKPLGEQIAEGKAFFGRLYPDVGRYLVYFQSFSNTYADLDTLRRLYEEALSVEGVVGLVIGTRPDCVDDCKLDYLADLATKTHITVEYGIESTCDETLRRVNRGHDFAAAQRAVEETARRGIFTAGHFILGFPGESDEMLLDQCDRINRLPLTSVKFHQLQIFRDTPLAKEYDLCPDKFRFWTPEEYVALAVEILRRLRPTLVVERFVSSAPPRFLHWSVWQKVKKDQLFLLLEERLERLNVHQGEIFYNFAHKL